MDRPIGIFDSGIGGLTVVRALRAALPHEDLVYLGDTARVPYGTKSADVVTRYALNCARFLQAKHAKLIVVACNTASATAIEPLQRSFDVPVVGVIEAGVGAALSMTSNNHVGVIGTEATIKSKAYQAGFEQANSQIVVTSRACPLFVPLAEEDMGAHPATRLIAQDYLKPLEEAHIDTLVLGCTHYPLLTPILADICGPQVRIVDSASAVAARVTTTLKEHQLNTTSTRMGRTKLHGTDVTERFFAIGQRFLGDSIAHVEHVDLQDYV